MRRTPFTTIALIVILFMISACGQPTTPTVPPPTAVPLPTATAIPIPPTPIPPTPTATVTPTQPVAVKPYEYNGVRLSLPVDLSINLYGSIPPRRDDAVDAPSGEITYPQHVRIAFPEYPVKNSLLKPQIYVYPAPEYEKMYPRAAQAIQELRTLLKDQPAAPKNIPVLPSFNAAQVFRSQVKYLKFQNGSGVRFVTLYSQAVLPINNQYLTYFFQGLTSDGAYYVSAVLPVTLPYLEEDTIPDANPPPGGIPFPALTSDAAKFDAYYASVTTKINQSPGEDFNPNLAKFDVLVESLLAKPDMAAIDKCVEKLSATDVNYEDGTKVKPGESFNKTWKLRNTGTCVWKPDYRLIFFDGERMNGYNVPLGKTVNPTDSIDVSVGLTAPSKPGLYRGYWYLQNSKGMLFGFEKNKISNPFWVEIEVVGSAATVAPTGVVTPTLAGTPTVATTPLPLATPTQTRTATSQASSDFRVTLSIDQDSFSGKCPHTFNLPIQITMSSAATVEFFLDVGTEGSGVDFSIPAKHALPRGTSNLNYSIYLSNSLKGFAVVRVTAPREATSNRVSFTLTCQ